jgi:signal peptidase I
MRRVVVWSVSLLALVIAAAVGVLATSSYRVHGPSMEPTLPDGTIVIANPLIEPARLDVVVYAPLAGIVSVRRVVGIPGDRVRIGEGQVEVQPSGTGEWQRVAGLSEPVEGSCDPDGTSSGARADTLVPAGTYFLLGDNLARSLDSRTQGFVTADQVRGVVIFGPINLPTM